MGDLRGRPKAGLSELVGDQCDRVALACECGELVAQFSHERRP